MDAWNTMLSTSTASSGADAWVHLNSQGIGGGFITIPVLSEINIEVSGMETIAVNIAEEKKISILINDTTISVKDSESEISVFKNNTTIPIIKC
tara:strand:- start:20145 stop:20426 length:282 start_codon:yes stop_codon:yes gene_type:complete